MSDRTHFVYTAYDSDDVVLYVGCTGRPEQRYKQHMSGNGDARGWFNHFVTRWHVSGPYAFTTARELERERIATLKPVWNGHSPRNYGGRRQLIGEYLASQRARFTHDDDGRPVLIHLKKRSAA